MLKYTSSIYLLILFLIIFQSNSKEAYPLENSVYKLNEDNLGFAMHEFKYLTLLFYSSTDPNCQSIIPEFEKSASILRKQNFYLGKVDSDESPEIISYFKVDTIPSIVLLYHAKPEFYDGVKNSDSINKWILEKTKRDFNIIKSEKELEEFKKLYDISMIYFGKNDKIKKEIILAERKIDDIPMGRIESDELIKSHAEKGKENILEYIVLYTKTDLLKYYLYDNFTSDNIIDFYNLYSTPKVIEFSAQTSTVLFSKRLNSLLIFSSRAKEQYQQIKHLLEEKIWPKVNEKLKLFIADIDEGMSVRLAEYCGAKNKDIPIAYILEPITQNPVKYRLQETITEESLNKFISLWEEKKLKPYMKTEPEIDNYDNEVFSLVGTNYKKYVIENDKDVIIYFYAPWCEKCKDFYPKYERLARKLRNKNKNLMFAKLDATENDIEYFAVNKYPTIKFYPGNKKDKEPINISNKLGIVEILDIIKENAYYKINEEGYDRNKEIEIEKKEREEAFLYSEDL